MIRDKFYKDIITVINSHTRFDSIDFKIKTVKDDRNISTLLTIQYNFDSKYKIIFKIPSSVTIDKDGYSPYYSFTGSVCPGPVAIEESFSFKGEDTVFTKISLWLNCIWEEISANPIVKQIENQQNQINEIFERFESIKDDYFTIDEAKELKKKLDDLENTLKSQLQQQIKDKKGLEEEINKLHLDIDTLKTTIASFDKKGWLKSLSVKVFKWSTNANHAKLIKGGYTLIREFLPDEIKNSPPE